MTYTRGRSRGRNRRNPNNSPQYGGWLIFARPEQHWFFRALGLVVRARAELTVTTLIIVVYLWLNRRLAPDSQSHTLSGHPTQRTRPPTEWLHTETLLAMTAGILVLMIIPVSRRYLIRRFWCVLARHRVRACMVQMFTMARQNGRMPFLLWSRPSSVGEHLTVWLPAGLAVKDLERITDHLATACWAKQVHIVTSEWRASLAHIYIGRRELLNRVRLTPDITTTDTDTDGDQTVKPASGRHLYPVRDLAEETASLRTLTPAAKRANDGATPTTQAAEPDSTQPAEPKTQGSPPAAAATTTSKDSPPVTGYGGYDVSDYI